MIVVSKGQQKVSVYYDWENLRWSSLVKTHHLEPGVIARTVRDYASKFGSVVQAYAYANFEHPDFATLQSVLHGSLVETRHASSRTSAGVPRKNVADIEMSLDVQEELLKENGSDVFVLVTGDSDMFPIVRRLRSRSKEVYIVSPRDSLSGELKKMATGAVTLEELLGMPGPTTPPPTVQDAVVKLHDMESEGKPFVAFTLLQKVIGRDEHVQAARDVINRCISEGSIEVYKVPNPHGEHDTTAVRLVRDHPSVRAIIGSAD